MTQRSVRLALAVIISLLVCATREMALAQPTIAQASSEQQEAARSAYAQGVEAFERGEYAAALTRFEAADAAVSSPNVKLMRARCLARLGRHAEADAMYGATLREAARWDDGRYQASADAATQEQRELARNLSPSPPDAAGAAPGAGPAVDGSSSTAPASVALQVAPAELPQPSAPPPAAASSNVTSGSDRGLPILPIVLGAAGGVGLASFAVFGSMSESEWGKLDGACSSDKRCAPSLSKHAERGRTYQTIANVSLGVAAALLATSATLFVLHVSEGAPEIAFTPSGVHVRGAL